MAVRHICAENGTIHSTEATDLDGTFKLLFHDYELLANVR